MIVRLVAVILVLAAVGSPWPFGSVSPMWWGAGSALILAVGTIAVLASMRRERTGSGGAWQDAVLLLCLPLVGACGLVPLPHALADVLSPVGGELLRSVGAGSAAWLRPLSLDVDATWDAVTVAAACSVLAWTVARGSATRTAAGVLTALFVVGGCALAAFGLAQRLIDPDPQKMFWSIEIYEVGTPFGPYVNRNHFGGAMLLFSGVTGGAVAAAWSARRRIVSALLGGALLLQLTALLATTSRGAVLGLVAALLVLAVRPVTRAARIRAWVGVAALAAICLAAVWGLGLLDGLTARAFHLSGRWTNRFAVQVDALRVFARFPISGTGAGTFPSVYGIFQSIDDLRFFRDAHSDWVQFLMETGLIGLAYMVVAGRAARRVWRHLWTAQDGHARLGRGALLGLVAIAVHGFFETNLHIPANAFLASAVVGLAWGASRVVGNPACPSSSRTAPDDESPVMACGIDSPSGPSQGVSS